MARSVRNESRSDGRVRGRVSVAGPGNKGAVKAVTAPPASDRRAEKIVLESAVRSDRRPVLPQPASDSLEAERSRVLQVAAKLFRDQGFDKTTVRQIAEACDLLPGSLHYRYKSKDDILVDMMRIAIDRTIRSTVAAVAAEDEPSARIQAAVRAHMRVLLSGDDMVYVLLFEWRALSGDARTEIMRERDRYERHWDAMLDALRIQGFIREDVDIHTLRLIGLGAINWMATWYRPNGPLSIDEICDRVWTILSRGVLSEGKP